MSALAAMQQAGLRLLEQNQSPPPDLYAESAVPDRCSRCGEDATLAVYSHRDPESGALQPLLRQCGHCRGITPEPLP